MINQKSNLMRRGVLNQLNFAFDKLIFYSALIFIVGILISSAKWIYCSRNFPICRYQFMVDKPMLKAIASFLPTQIFPTSRKNFPNW